MEIRNKTTVAYRCPHCGAILTFDVTRERLEKGKMNMPCIQCGKSHLDIMKEPSGSISLLVPCLMCPHPHPYKISPEMFFEKEIYCFPCSFTGIDICFIGDADYVDDEIIRSGREISDLIEETNEEDANAKDANVMVADTSVMREVLFAIGNLQEDKKIKCTCGSSAVKVLLDYDKAVIVCKVCGKKKEIAARSRFDANAAIDMDEIFIS